MRLALYLLLGAVVLGIFVSALSSIAGLIFWAAVAVGIVAGVAALLRRPADSLSGRGPSRRQHRRAEKKADRALAELERKVGRQG